MNPYKWLYTYLTPWWKRPWTYVRRDFFHQYEIVNIVFFVSIGFFSGLFYPRIVYWIVSTWYNPIILVSIFYFVGVLQGHFFWGKKYIEGQK